MGAEPPNCTIRECETFFEDIFKEAKTPSTTPSWLPPQLKPLQLPRLVITASMVQNALKNKCTKSAPGLDGITYQLLQRLPWAPQMLATQFNKIISQQVCPEIWRYGVTVLLHKGGERTLPNYRPITLTATISKLFHGIVSSWLERAVVSASIIKTSVQKGFSMGVAGAIEHDLVLDATLQDAKVNCKAFAMLLVDLKNAFGSVPHQRILWTLARFGVPEWLTSYVGNFYGGVHTQMTSKTWSTRYLQKYCGATPLALSCS